MYGPAIGFKRTPPPPRLRGPIFEISNIQSSGTELNELHRVYYEGTISATVSLMKGHAVS